MSARGARVLVVDDEPEILRALRTNLAAHGYDVSTATTAAEAQAAYAARRPDLILLDLGLPDADGLQLVERIRSHAATPIVVLSARGAERDKVRALDLGADDYVVKPFGVDELLARIRAVLRRQAAIAEGEPVIRAGDLELDLGRREVRAGGRPVHLTPTEYEVLRVLALHAGRPVTHTSLLRQVWGEYAVGDRYNTRYVVAQLRRKLGDDPARPRYIVNEPGVGYRLEA